MTYDDALAALRSWCSQAVVIVLEPEGSVMQGRLQEIDADGVDGAMFAVDGAADSGARTTGVAIALFRDAFASAELAGDLLRVRQGRVEIIVRRQAGTAAPPPAR